MDAGISERMVDYCKDNKAKSVTKDMYIDLNNEQLCVANIDVMKDISYNDKSFYNIFKS